MTIRKYILFYYAYLSSFFQNILIEKLGKLGIKVTEKIDKELFDAILKSGKKLKKKKRGKKR